MTTRRLDADVVVIGAGPAGATAAGLLASWGHSVVLVHGESDSPSLAESLPASTRKLLRFLGQLDAVDAASFHPNHGNISRWAGKEAVASTTAGGYHVARSAFDRVLRDHARGHGAVLVNGHVRRVDLGAPVLVEGTGEHEPFCCSGRFILDCSGRAGVVARRGLRRADAGYRTLAVVGEWTADDWPVAERTHTVVDSYDRGWAWSVPLSPTRRQCTVMIDADRTTIRKTTLERIYADELQRARGISDRLAGAVRTGPVWACDASIYDSIKAFDGDVFLVGDAGSFVETLSSGGVKKALSSAWTAAVVVNTCLINPAMRTAASELFDRRERQVYAEYERHTAAFFEDAARVYGDSFWDARARAGRTASLDAGVVPSDFELGHDPGLRATFEALRDVPRLALQADPRMKLEGAPVVEGRQVVLREGIVIPGIPVPVRFAAGVNLPELVKMVADCQDVSSLLAAYEARVAPVDPRDLLIGLSFLVSRGLLTAAHGGD